MRSYVPRILEKRSECTNRTSQPLCSASFMALEIAKMLVSEAVHWMPALDNATAINPDPVPKSRAVEGVNCRPIDASNRVSTPTGDTPNGELISEISSNDLRFIAC